VSDGREYVVLASAQDHKRVFDQDEGKNTGGMGAYAPAPVVTPAVMKAVEESVIRPTLQGMEREGRPYRGCLYCGLMITAGGPKVIEYNVRFGDPETQVVLPLYRGDLALLLAAAARGRLASLEPAPPAVGSAVCVVLASGGYPDTYTTGFPISGLDRLGEYADVVAFHAGTQIMSGIVCTSGGRVLGVTAVREDSDLRSAIERAYQAVAVIRFDHMHFRKDIGRRALARRAT
jgi:phosphoribosylamine--glycine ligase